MIISQTAHKGRNIRDHIFVLIAVMKNIKKEKLKKKHRSWNLLH